MSCQKVTWPDRRTAKRFLRTKSWKGRTYHCDGCGGWHTTSYDAASTTWYREKKAEA